MPRADAASALTPDDDSGPCVSTHNTGVGGPPVECPAGIVVTLGQCIENYVTVTGIFSCVPRKLQRKAQQELAAHTNLACNKCSVGKLRRSRYAAS